MMPEPLVTELDMIKARLLVLEETVKTLQGTASAPVGTSGTLTPLDKPVSTAITPTNGNGVTDIDGWVTPKGDPVNVRWDTRIAPETFLYKLNDTALVKGSKKDDAGFTWYRISNAPDSYVREDVVTFSSEMPAPVKAGKFPAPFVGYIVTNRHGIDGHMGVDMATFDRTPAIVSATMNGYVVKTALCGGCGPTPGLRVKSNNFGYGNFVIAAYPLSTGDWLHCLMAHLGAIHVHPTQILSESTVIANVGNTGDSSGNHLHMQCRLSNTRDARWSEMERREVNPIEYFEI